MQDQTFGICGGVGAHAAGSVDRMVPGGDAWGRVDFPGSGVHLACERVARTPGLRPQGPGASEDGTLGAVFAGWLHNSEELREEVGLAPVATESDLLLRLYREHGTGLVQRLRGRFVFALWDDVRHQLVLVRDAVGVRVLYTLEQPDGILFASRIKSLLRSGRSRRELDLPAADTLLALRRIPGRSTLVSDIERLPPGCMLVRRPESRRLERWFDLTVTPDAISLEEAREELDLRLRRALGRCSPPNERVGLFYSGGVDSTRLLELLVRGTNAAVETFTFLTGKDHGDFVTARRVTRRLGVERTEVDVRDVPFESMFADLLWRLDEPIADLSVLNPAMLLETASRKVRYSMDGIGTDQALGGCFYHRPLYFVLRHGRLPGLRRLLGLAGEGLARVPLSPLSRLVERLEPSYSIDDVGRTRMARLLGSAGEPRRVMELLIALMQRDQRLAL